MADTVSTANLRAKLYGKQVWEDAMDGLFFKERNMMGSGDNVIVTVLDDLMKDKGDTITLPLTYKLSGAGVTGDSTLEGNEEAINSYDETIVIDQWRNAVRMTGRYDEQRVAYNMRQDAKNKLAVNLQEFIERQIFMKLGGVTETDLTDVNGTTYSANAAWSNSANPVPAADEASGSGDRYICADSDGVDVNADNFSSALISRAKRKAQLAGPKVRPLRVDGKDYYVLFIHPWQGNDLRADTAFVEAQRHAQVRGNDNPIFSGAFGIYDGVIIHEHEYVPTAQATANFDGSGTAVGTRAFRALLCGRQACALAKVSEDRGPGMQEETFDYHNKVGYATGLIGGIQKPTFNSLDYGVIAIDSAATAL